MGATENNAFFVIGHYEVLRSKFLNVYKSSFAKFVSRGSGSILRLSSIRTDDVAEALAEALEETTLLDCDPELVHSTEGLMLVPMRN